MLYNTYEEQQQRTAEIYAERDFLKDKLKEAKDEAKQKRIKERIEILEAEAEELFFTPTREDLEEAKYWI